jgi:hypothetical protein
MDDLAYIVRRIRGNPILCMFWWRIISLVHSLPVDGQARNEGCDF